MTKLDLFNLTSPKGMFTPDSIHNITSWDGNITKVYSKNIDGATLTAGSLDRLEEMVKQHTSQNIDSMVAFMKSINL